MNLPLLLKSIGVLRSKKIKLIKASIKTTLNSDMYNEGRSIFFDAIVDLQWKNSAMGVVNR